VWDTPLATLPTDKNIVFPAWRLQLKILQTKPTMPTSYSYSHHLPLPVDAGEFTLNTFTHGFYVVHLESQSMIGSREKNGGHI